MASYAAERAPEKSDPRATTPSTRPPVAMNLPSTTAVAAWAIVTPATSATALVDGRYLSTGGRVLGVVARAADFAGARSAAYEAIGRIDLEGGFYRHDIAERVAT